MCECENESLPLDCQVFRISDGYDIHCWQAPQWDMNMIIRFQIETESFDFDYVNVREHVRNRYSFKWE